MTELQAALARMKVGDRIGLESDEVLCVPGGWIFYKTLYSGDVPIAITSTFVARGPKPDAKHEKRIISLLGKDAN